MHKKTVELYETSFANGSSPYDTPAYRKSKDGRYWVIYNKSTGKILKNYKYTPACFADMLAAR